MEPYIPANASVVGKVMAHSTKGGKLAVTVDFGDGSPVVDVGLDSEGHFAAGHVYTSMGSYDVTVIYTKD